MASVATLLVTAFWTIDPFTTLNLTTFTAGAQNTLPLWIFGAIRLGQRLPEVNVVVSFVILITIIPVLIAARLTGGGATRVPAAATESPPITSTAPAP
jgi:ABC-type spermidine/putrescine transport system permease subunit II